MWLLPFCLIVGSETDQKVHQLLVWGGWSWTGIDPLKFWCRINGEIEEFFLLSFFTFLLYSRGKMQELDEKDSGIFRCLVEFYLNRRSGGLKLWFSSYGWFDIQWFRVVKFYIGSGFMGSKETAGPQRRYVLDYSTLICCFFIIRERKLITVGLKNFIHIAFSPTTVKKCFTKSNKTRGRSRFVFVGSTSNYPPLP